MVAWTEGTGPSSLTFPGLYLPCLPLPHHSSLTVVPSSLACSRRHCTRVPLLGSFQDSTQTPRSPCCLDISSVSSPPPSHPPEQEVISLLRILGPLSLYFVVVHINFSFLSKLATCISYIISELASFLMTGVIPHPPLWPHCTQSCKC